MWLIINGQKSTFLENDIVLKILDMYPEEQLMNRDVFKDAFSSDQIEFKNLKEESGKCLIPWQIFFLNKQNLNKELKHIENQRADKVSSKLFAKRRGTGNITSNRIIDRLIRLQNYISSRAPLVKKNPFCDSLQAKNDADVLNHITSYFDIDLDRFRNSRNKSIALNYLIKKIEEKYINISQGVLTNKILPNWQVVNNNIYKNTSGFVIKDDRIPFLFLPSEVNPDESDGRQIYTLIYLLLVIGLGKYSYFLDKDFKTRAITAKGQLAKIHRLTGKFLLPIAVTENLIEQGVTTDVRDLLSEQYKITPTAVVVILKMRKIISTEVYNRLLPAPYVPSVNQKKNTKHSPHIDTSVRKFCGKYSFEIINEGIRKGAIKSVQAQYLIFGSVNKKGYKNYLQRLAI